MQTLVAMIGLIRSQRRRFVVTIFLNTLLGLGALVPPYLVKVVVDALIKVSRDRGLLPQETRFVLYALGGLAILRVLLALAGYVQERISDVLRLDAIMELRHRLFEHVLGLSVDYYETNKVGEIIQRLTQGVYEFGTWMQDVAQLVLLRILTIILSVIVVAAISPLAGLIAAITVVAKLGLALRKKQASRAYRLKAHEMIEQMQGQITESVQNLTTLRSFGGEPGALRTHKTTATGMRAARLHQHQIEWKYNAGIELIEGLGITLTIAAIAYSALQGRVSPGSIVLVALYLQQVMSNLKPMATFIDNTGELISTCERMLELLAVEPTVSDRPEAVDLRGLDRIEFRDVSFHYPGHEEVVIHNISFVLEPGQMLALVGPSGTGKTTIVKLLLRLYEPTEGQILINGRDVASVTAGSLRHHIGSVMQDVALFNDTFAANVLLANPEADAIAVKRAVHLAHADEFVEHLPHGYDTLVGERGIKLSGGQKQRVAIARAILKEPDLVILDEATSALDSVSEREVQAGLSELTRGRMAVVIAHRLSTVRKADQILVIKHGRVVESGGHEQLLKGGGLYSELFRMQSK